MRTDDKFYKEMVKKNTPPSKRGKDFFFAFVIGGGFCVLGQLLRTLFFTLGLNEEMTGLAVSVALIGLSVLLTSLGLYSKIARVAGAGSLVPITGFANAVASPAIEFKTEGWLTGISVKMFAIAGPVVVLGIFFTSSIGVLYHAITTIFGGE